jgi:hypothetical protein
MQPRAYFASDESENAATGRIVETFRNANAAKAKLEAKLTELGVCLGEFARTLQNPDQYVFDIGGDSVTVGKHGGELRRPLARVTARDLEWDDLREALKSYAQAKADRENALAQLKAIGLPLD